MLVEPFETFKVCAYKVDENFGRCTTTLRPYFSENIKIDLNGVSNVKIPVSKDVDTTIYFQWENENALKYQSDTVIKYYSNKPKKYTPAQKVNPSKGKWVKKCKTITTTEVLKPGDLTASVLNGGSGPRTYNTRVCEDVWVP